MRSKQLLIAEVKTKSPFGWQTKQSWDELFDLACEYGDIISIHTDPRWGGSFELLAKARKHTAKPLLAKGIHADDAMVAQALDSGANYVLVVGRVPKIHAEQCLIEPETLEQLASLNSNLRAVWNSRDLATGGNKIESFDQAKQIWSGWLCQASNIRSVSDVDPRADAILVGSNLPEFITSLKCIKE